MQIKKTTPKSNKKLVIGLLILSLVIIVFPLMVVKNAPFEGSDGAASGVVEEISVGYTPWFEPVVERFLGQELPGEIESLLFSVQTGIGTGIIGFIMGRWVERKKQENK